MASRTALATAAEVGPCAASPVPTKRLAGTRHDFDADRIGDVANAQDRIRPTAEAVRTPYATPLAGVNFVRGRTVRTMRAVAPLAAPIAAQPSTGLVA